MPKASNSHNLVTKDFLEEKLDKLEKKIDENSRQYRNDVLNKLDEVMGELQTRREERTLETHQYSEFVEEVAGHEKRITNLSIFKKQHNQKNGY